MKKIAVLVGITIIVFGCGSKETHYTSMNEEEYQEYQKLEAEAGNIAVETSFVPTLDPDEYINNTSLEEIIIQHEEEILKEQSTAQSSKGKHQSDFSRLEPPHKYKSSIDVIREYELKYVPATSKLAKVYYLEDRNGFLEHNQQYVCKIMDRIRNGSKKNEKQKNWDRYL